MYRTNNLAVEENKILEISITLLIVTAAAIHQTIKFHVFGSKFADSL